MAVRIMDETMTQDAYREESAMSENAITRRSFLAGSAESSDLPREQSANLLTARNAVARKDASTVGDESDISADYMDVAIPIFGGDNAFIIYILDNKDTVSDLNNQLFQIRPLSSAC